MRHESRTVDQIVAAIAGRAHGVVTRAQLLDAGITLAEIRHRLHAGTLIRVHPGVYRVGHAAPSLHATYLAAVLACGAGALLCGTAAAQLMGLVKQRTPPPPQVVARTERRVRGVATRRSRGMGNEKWVYDGVPVTTVPRTLVDLAALLHLDDLSLACYHAGTRFKTTPAQVKRILRPNAPGAARLIAVMEGRAPVTLSTLERKFRSRLRAAKLRLPDESNRPAGTYRVDCRWREPPLTVELDSYRFHNNRRAWEQDQRRAREAYARGDEFRRYTYGDVFEDPRAMLTELTALLTRP
jgi:very-short-patch-repair endonuclease